MVAAPGNQYAKKLKTDELKKEAYRQYCDHIAQGFPKKAWCFDHPTLTLTWETMEKYIKESEQDFDPLHKKVAEAKSYKHWFSILGMLAKGENQKANPAALQMIFRNMFEWDKPVEKDVNAVPELLQGFNAVMKQIAKAQEEVLVGASNE